AVEALTQVAAARVLEERAVARGVERDAPRAGLGGRVGVARLARRLRRELQQARRQAGDLVGRRQRERERLGRVEDVVREPGRALGELGLDRVEALLGCALEAHAGKLGVADERVDDAPLRSVELAKNGAFPEALQRPEERSALTEAHRERDDL